MKKSVILIITIFLLCLSFMYTKTIFASTIVIDNQSAGYGEEVVFTVKIGPWSKSVESFWFDLGFDNKALKLDSK